MTAEQYNKDALGKFWLLKDLPLDLLHSAESYGVGSPEFAYKVQARQKKYNLKPDRMLGPLTLEILIRNENLRQTQSMSEWPDLGAVALPTQRQEPKRTKKIQYVIVHTTGTGVYNMVPRWGSDPFKAAVAYYRSPSAYTSHYIAGLKEKEFVQVVGLDEVAWHAGVGSVGSTLYRSGDWRNINYPMSGKPITLNAAQSESYYGWWQEKWGYKFSNPLQLTDGDPNGTSVGFDFLAYPMGGDYTDWQFDCLARVCVRLRDRFGIPIDKRHILTHSDTHPIQRCVKSGGWDPGPKFTLERLHAAVARIGG